MTRENLRNADAIEIKIGQGTKPGMGGHLPGSKVTPEIAAIRNKPLGEDVISPSKFPDINTKEDLKALVTSLREESDGRPIGIKIAAGKLERDLEFCVLQSLILLRSTDAAALQAPARSWFVMRPVFRPFMLCIVPASILMLWELMILRW